MKKLTIIPLAFLFFNFSFLICFAQTTNDKEIEKLCNDIKVLVQKHNKLKKDYTENVIALNKSIDDLNGLYKGTDNKVILVEDLLATTSAKVSSLEEKTNNRFLRYRGIIKTAIILALIVMGTLTVLLLLLYLKLKKEHNLVTKNLAIHEKALSNLNDKLSELNKDFNTQINSTYEKLISKIKEINK